MCHNISRFIVVFCCLVPALCLCREEIPVPVEWESPLPKVSELNIDLKEVENLIGQYGQFIYLRDPQTVTSWTKGDMVDHPDGVIVTAMKIVQAPLEKVRQVIRDYSLISQIQSQHKDVRLVSQKGNHTLYSYNQEYKMGVITLNADFLMQQTVEKDGSVSLLLHDGDVDAQVQRWEFLALDEERTLVMLTFWSAYHTARFAFRVIMSAMQESHLVAPAIYCSMYLEQYTRYLEKDRSELPTEKKDIREKPVTPRYAEKLSDKERALLESLVEKGMVFLRTFQYANIDGEIQIVPFVSTFDMLNVPFEKASPIVQDILNFEDSITIVKSVKAEENGNGTLARIKYRMARFPVAIPLFTQQIYEKTGDDYLTFENRDKEGAYYPYLGAYEWNRIKKENDKDATLYILTQAFKVGPNANFYIRTLSKLMQDSENVQIITSSIIMVRNRIEWIEKNFGETPKEIM